MGGEGASDSSDANEGANTKLTISGGVRYQRPKLRKQTQKKRKASAGGALTI